MSNLVEYAKSELKRIGGDDCEMQQAMNQHIIKMVQVFADEGHSGFSASYALSILKKLLDYKPLTPLTGEDDEWLDPYEGSDSLQNKRCSSVFKNKETGEVYDINGKAFRDTPNDPYYGNKESRVVVTFPYVPKTEYITKSELKETENG